MTAPTVAPVKMHRIITRPRLALVERLAGFPWDVYSYLPDDLGAMPCLVIEQPRIRVARREVTTTVSVVVVGRRLADEDSQEQLDLLTDDVFDWLSQPFDNTGLGFWPEGVTPGTVRVAGQDFPAYSVSVQFNSFYC